MTAYLPIHESIQPVNEITPAVQKSEKTAPDLQITQETESEGDPEPLLLGDKIASIEETTSALLKVFKEDKNLTTKLVKYSGRKLIEIIGQRDDGKTLPADILAEAIVRLMDGRRKWNQTKQPNIVHQIILVIVSLIKIEAAKIPDTENQLYKEYETEVSEITKRKNKRARIIQLYYSDNDGKRSVNTISDDEDFSYDSLQKLQDEFNFENLDENQLINSIEVALEDNDNEFFVFQELLNGNKSNIDIAKKLDISVKDVENAKKRIRRKTKWLKD